MNFAEIASWVRALRGWPTTVRMVRCERLRAVDIAITAGPWGRRVGTARKLADALICHSRLRPVDLVRAAVVDLAESLAEELGPAPEPSPFAPPWSPQIRTDGIQLAPWPPHLQPMPTRAEMLAAAGMADEPAWRPPVLAPRNDALPTYRAH